MKTTASRRDLFKGAAALGALRLSRRCQDIEILAREQGIEPVMPLLDTLDNELALALKGLSAVIGDHDEPRAKRA